MIHRHTLTVTVLLVAVTLSVAPPSVRADDEELTDEEVLKRLTTDHPRDIAIRKALAFLRDQQQDDGSVGKAKHRTTQASFALMAHLSAGITFDDPEHGEWMRRSIDYVLSQQGRNGFFGDKDDSRMYGHGITTLMLAEAVGMIEEPLREARTREALRKAINLIINAQQKPRKDRQHAGGWRYEPDSRDSDLSLSGWQIMSLHAAQQVGITVEEKVVKQAVDYAIRLTSEDGKVGYQRRGDDRPALRGLGMLCFAVVRKENDKLVDAIAERIERDPIEWNERWFYYRVYYDAVGMARARPKIWQRYRDRLEGELLPKQNADGSWPACGNEGGYGAVYRTSMAVLALAVERHVLPVYQR